jgi:RNA polymerase sigma factor (sigma-70 family)
MLADDQRPQADGGLAPTGGREPTADAARMAAVRDCFFEFFDAEYVLVVRFLMRCGANLHDAEDAAQEAFTDAWVHMGRDGKWTDVTEPRGWIRRVALRKYHRPPGRRPRLQTVSVADVPELRQHDIGNDDMAAETLSVVDALRRLDPPLPVIMGFHRDGLTAVEIGAQLGMTAQQVRDLIKKARRILARELAGIRDPERRPHQ